MNTIVRYQKPSLFAMSRRFFAEQMPTKFFRETDSPHGFIAECAAQEIGLSINNNSNMKLFGSAVEKRPLLFQRAQFRYVSPKEFGYEPPNDGIPEVAFLGRSNVGKSSLINAITQHKGLARTSKTPGCTQTVNYYEIHNNKYSKSNKNHRENKLGYLVDLPGYGFAKAPDKKLDMWQKITQEFIHGRDVQVFKRLFLLIDSRHEIKDIDAAAMAWLDEAQIPYTLVLTKTDKSKKIHTINLVNQLCMRFHSQLYGNINAAQAPFIHLTSAKKPYLGINELLWAIQNEIQS